MVIKKGTKAPDFGLPDESGKIRRLVDYRGSYVVLYFYPKDDTPGCTTEACNFRDDYSQYQAAGVQILGISPDSTASHEKFKSKHTLPFDLLSDQDHKICDLYGTWGPKKSFGKEYQGVLRTTYLIDPDGDILEVFENVSPANHSSEVLAALNNT